MENISCKLFKNILVTGGCGFIGSNFVNYTVEKYPEYNFINIDVMYYCASLENINDNVKKCKNYKFIQGDINDIDLIKYILKEEKVTHIIHFAAQSHVDTSFENSLQYTYDNVKGTHTLLEAVRQINKDIVFLHFSTDEVYGESKDGEDAKHEQSILCPTNPYAASKAAAEMYVNAYNHSYHLNTIITRGNNVYGPNQYPEKLIPKFIGLLKAGKKCTIHGDGTALRSFIHVYDVCTAVDTILHKGIIGEVYNIGSEPENELSVLEVTKMLIEKLYGIEETSTKESLEKYIVFVKDRPFNDKRYFITNQKIKNLGWNQKKYIYTEIKKLIDL
jgi:dTDP-glucose 4,6-dehydratase/UDP-glucose 4,6-dehydratase